MRTVKKKTILRWWKTEMLVGQNQFQRCEGKQREPGVEVGLEDVSPVLRELGDAF